MLFHVDPSSSVPIYAQLVEQVKSATASGLLQAGEQLPSVRELAVLLTVNPNTVSRAYQELERDGVIYTQRGRGTFVAVPDERLTAQARHKLLEQHIDRLLIEAYHLRISHTELLELIKSKLQKAKEGQANGSSDQD